MSRPAFCAAIIALVGMGVIYAFSFVASIVNSDQNNFANADVRGQLLAAHTRRIIEMPMASVAMIASLPYTGLLNVALDASLDDATTIWTAMAGACDGSVNGLMYGLTGNDGSYFAVYCGQTSTSLQWVSRVTYVNASFPRYREYYNVYRKHDTPYDNQVELNGILKTSSSYPTLSKSWVVLGFNTGTPVFEPVTISFSTGQGQSTFVQPFFSTSGSVAGVGAYWLEPVFWTTKFASVGSGFLLIERSSGVTLFCSDEAFQLTNGTMLKYAQMSSKYYNSDIRAMVDALSPPDPTKQGTTRRFVSQNVYVAVYSVNMLLNQTSVGPYGPGAAALDMAIIAVTQAVPTDVTGTRPLAILVAGGVVALFFSIVIFAAVTKCTPAAAKRDSSDYTKELNAE